MAEERIIPVEYETEMGQSYVDYAMSVISDRAVADIRDGLKPVQRRTLYALSSLARSDGQHRKCARIVGDTMGKFHPHGDSSIYEALVNMAQPWKMPIVLVDGHGNFGSYSGDGAAAMRYTEARMTKYIEETGMKDIRFFKDSFIPNFDGTETEPTFLPFQVPNYLVSGSTGIAVGMAANIPSHNLEEVLDSFTAYLKNPDISTEELLDIIPGPDFATGGIVNATKDELLNIYETGSGKIKVRGKIEVRDAGYGRKAICITEIPYTMIGKTTKFLESITDIAAKKKITAIMDVYDQSDKDGCCFTIEVKRGTTDKEIENIINVLYKNTGLEDTYSYNMLYINDGKPEIGGIKRIYQLYSNFKTSLYNTKYEKLLDAQLEEYEIKSGLVEAVDKIDLIIDILRGSKKQADAKACLINGDTSNIVFRHKEYEKIAKNLSFTEKQADAILEMRFRKLIGLEAEALIADVKKAKQLIQQYKELLSDKKKMTKQMIKDMSEIKKLFAIPRKTKIEDIGEVVVEEVKEDASEVAVLLDRFYYIKVIPASVYEKNMEQIESDYRYSLKCMSDQRIAIFDNKNQMQMIKVADILKLQLKKNSSAKKISMLGKLSDKGIQIFEFCKMSGDENILYMDCLEHIIEDKLLFVTKNGTAKIVAGNLYDVTRKCITASKEFEEMAYIGVVGENNWIVARSSSGYFARISLEEYSPKGKGAACSKFMKIEDGEQIEQVQIGTTKDFIECHGEKIPFTRIKAGKKGSKGTKLRL